MPAAAYGGWGPCPATPRGRQLLRLARWLLKSTKSIASSVLADKGLADMVRLEDARPGDFYHVFRERGAKAHSAIVEENHMTDVVEPRPDYGPHLVIYGAHSRPGYVTSIRSRGFDDPNVKVFISRLRPEAIRKRR